MRVLRENDLAAVFEGHCVLFAVYCSSPVDSWKMTLRIESFDWSFKLRISSNKACTYESGFHVSNILPP